MSPFTDNHPRAHQRDLFDVTSQPHHTHESWGDKMEAKDDRSLRLYFQNLNGLPTNDNWLEWNHIIQYVSDNNIDICGFAEPNVNWNKQLTATALFHLRSHVKPAALQTAACEEPTHYKYQRGGVMMTTVGKMTGRIGHSGHDTLGLGRWVYTTYHGRNGITLIIVTAYRVSQNHVTKGHHTAYNQQYRALRRKGYDSPKPKQLFCTHLLPLVQEWERKNYEIILMLDANEALDGPDFGRFLDQTALYDILGHHHSVHSPPTYIRGSLTIDFLLGTKNVLTATKACGMTAFNDTILTDHRGLWADIDIPELLKGSVPPPSRCMRIPLRTTQKHRITKIRNRGIHLFNSLRIQQRLQDLKQSCYHQPKPITLQMLETIDSDIDSVLLDAIPQTPPASPYWWSKEI